ncbi:MAG: hypothetical protein JNM93_04890, partial [Bacteriovoracaceae bacterium]|nr:hypothetical protein [Bacteriovoracaceae bacterium]
AQPYFRLFNPELQTKKFDPEQEFIKKFIPELATKKYPAPIVDYKVQRQRALEMYKMAQNNISMLS